MFKNFIICLFTLAVLVADSTSTTKITLREKYGSPIIVDSVTLAIIHDGNFYITRNKEVFGCFPLVNYSLQINKRD